MAMPSFPPDFPILSFLLILCPSVRCRVVRFAAAVIHHEKERIAFGNSEICKKYRSGLVVVDWVLLT